VVFLIAIAAIELLTNPVTRDDLLDALYFDSRRYVLVSGSVAAVFLLFAVLASYVGTKIRRNERLALVGSLGLIFLVAAAVVYAALQPYDPYRGLSDAEIAVLDVMYEFDPDLRFWDSDIVVSFASAACDWGSEDETGMATELTGLPSASDRVVHSYRFELQQDARVAEVYAFALQAITDLAFLEPEPVFLCEDDLTTLAVTFAVLQLREEWFDALQKSSEEDDSPLRFYPEG
jgi:hypothetical protein